MRPFLIFILVLSSLSAPAQLVLESVDACIQYSKQKSPRLQSAQRNAEASAEAKKIQNAALLPQIKVISNLDYYFSLPVQLIPAEILGGESGTYKAVSFGQPYSLNMGLEAYMPLINVSLWIGTKQAAIEAQAALIQLDQSKLSNDEAVAKAYYLTLLSRDALKLANYTSAANDSLLQQALHKEKNGLIEPLELNRIRSLQLESTRNKDENQQVYTNNLARLKLLLGLDIEEPLVLTETLGPELKPAAIKPGYSYTHLPEYRLAEVMVQRNKLRWQIERSRLLPELSVFGRFSWQAQRNEFNFTEAEQPWYEIGLAGLRLEWPVFTGFHRLSSTRKSYLHLEAAQLEKEHITRRLQQEQQELQNNYQQSSQSLQLAMEVYKLGKQNYGLAMLKYEAGILPLDQLINLYHEMLRAQNTLLKTLSDHLYYNALITTRNTY